MVRFIISICCAPYLVDVESFFFVVVIMMFVTMTGLTFRMNFHSVCFDNEYDRIDSIAFSCVCIQTYMRLKDELNQQTLVSVAKNKQAS